MPGFPVNSFKTANRNKIRLAVLSIFLLLQVLFFWG